MPTNRKGYINGYYHRERAKIIKKLGGKCLKCGRTDNLEIHHIKNGHKEVMSGAGQLMRLTEWKKNIDNLSLLCHEHHTEYHYLYPDFVNMITLLMYIMLKGNLKKDAIPI